MGLMEELGPRRLLSRSLARVDIADAPLRDIGEEIEMQGLCGGNSVVVSVSRHLVLPSQFSLPFAGFVRQLKAAATQSVDRHDDTNAPKRSCSVSKLAAIRFFVCREEVARNFHPQHSFAHSRRVSSAAQRPSCCLTMLPFLHAYSTPHKAPTDV